jgi:hypothetical protein
MAYAKRLKNEAENRQTREKYIQNGAECQTQPIADRVPEILISRRIPPSFVVSSIHHFTRSLS